MERGPTATGCSDAAFEDGVVKRRQIDRAAVCSALCFSALPICSDGALTGADLVGGGGEDVTVNAEGRRSPTKKDCCGSVTKSQVQGCGCLKTGCWDATRRGEERQGRASCCQLKRHHLGEGRGRERRKCCRRCESSKLCNRACSN